MTEIEQRAYIKICTTLDQSPTIIHDNLVKVYGEAAYSYRNVARWAALFKAGKSKLMDKTRSGRPITEMNKANIDLVQSLIDKNPRISYSILEEKTFLSRGTLNRIIKDKLKLTKRSSRWVPHKLSLKNKQQRLEFCQAILEKFRKGEWRLDQILTGDECIFYWRSIEKRGSSSSWKRAGEPPDTLVKRDRYEPKTMVVIFFRSSGPALIHAVEKGVTIDNVYYIDNCLSPAFESIRKQRRSSGLDGIKLLHDGAKPHIHYNVRNFIESNGVIEIDHPPYSPDLAPCDYWLFDYIKQHLGDQQDEKSLIKSITKIVKEILHKEWIKTFNKYIERLEKCVDVEGSYFEHLMK